VSAGHHAHRDDVPAVDDAFYRRVTDLVNAARRDRDHTIPWLANRSIDGRVVYIDVTVPKILPGTGIDTGETLPYHELGEWLGMNEGLDYDDAHATRGNPCEKRRVEALGGDWAAYQAEIAPYIRAVADEAMTSVPPDIDKRVFVDDDDQAALAAIIADNSSTARFCRHQRVHARYSATATQKRAGEEETPMQLQRKFVAGAVIADPSLGERQIRVVASDPTIDRVKDIMVPKGCVLDGYVKNNIFLADHDPTKPIGNAAVTVTADRVEALITFAPKDISPLADERCALYKAGVLTAVSIGFEPLEWEPIKAGGVRYTKWALLELSSVAVPANPNAVTIERSIAAASATKQSWKVGASRNLPLDEGSPWDSAAAENSIFDYCGFDGDKPNTAFARKAFLHYDAAAPDKRSSYQLPFAKMSGGRLVAVAAGIRAAAARLAPAEISDEVRKTARAVIDHYEGKMKHKAAGSPATKEIRRGKAGKILPKGLYECAELAQVLSHLGYIHNNAVWEAEVEQDASKLPGMLAAILTELAAALVAMTQEETDELLAGHGIEVLPIDEDYIAAAPTPATKALRSAFRKAGRVLSQANLDHLAAIGKCLKGITDCHQKAAQLHDDLHDTMVDMMDHGTSAGDHLKAMQDAAGAGDDDDNNNGDGIPDPSNSDQELAGEVAVRKRQYELMERAVPRT
jgi:HK97 family phage prohead protease